MVFKKRALGFSANISYDSCPKPSLLIQQHVYTQRKEKKKKTPIQQVILAQSTHTTVLLCWHIVTFTHTLISVRANMCLLMNSFTMDFVRYRSVIQ